MHPSPDYRRRTEVYTHKPEGQIEEEHFIIAKPLHGRIEEARPATIVTCIYRDGSIRLWPLKFPKPGEKDNEAWISARVVARLAMTKWVKLVWVRRTFQHREAFEGYAPDPDLSKLPPFDQLVKLATGPQGIIRNLDHSAYRDLIGAAPKKRADGDDLDL